MSAIPDDKTLVRWWKDSEQVAIRKCLDDGIPVSATMDSLSSGYLLIERLREFARRVTEDDPSSADSIRSAKVEIE